MWLISRLTLSKLLFAILAGAMLLLSLAFMAVDKAFEVSEASDKAMGESMFSAAKTAEMLFELPEELRPQIVRAMSGMATFYSLTDDLRVDHEAERFFQMEDQFSDMLESRGLPIDRVIIARREIVAPIRKDGGLRAPQDPLLKLGDKSRILFPDDPNWMPQWARQLPPGAEPLPPKPGDKLAPAVVSVIGIHHADTDQWLVVRSLGRAPPKNPYYTKLLILLGAALILTWVSYFTGDRLMRPFRDLAKSAEKLQRGEKSESVPVQGTRDLKDVIRTFNRMNERVNIAIDYQIGLLHSVGHDLKGPLSNASRLLKQVEPEKTRDQISGQLDRVDAMVQSIMTYSRAVIREGEMEDVDVSSLVETVVHELVDQGADAEVEVQEDVVVTCRLNAVERCIQNLVENAIKYGRTAHVKMQVEREMAVVSVSDEGPGIPETELDKVFDPFRRLNHALPGSGLGLSIVKTIAIDHGGSVSLKNLATGGLCAELRLPLPFR